MATNILKLYFYLNNFECSNIDFVYCDVITVTYRWKLEFKILCFLAFIVIAALCYNYGMFFSVEAVQTVCSRVFEQMEKHIIKRDWELEIYWKQCHYLTIIVSLII